MRRVNVTEKRKLAAMLMVTMAFSVMPQGIYTPKNTTIEVKAEEKVQEDVNAGMYYKPYAPENLSLTENKDGSMTVKWDASKYAKGYDVYKAESRFGDYKKVESTNTESYTDTNPNKCKYDNFYKVIAYNDADKSAFSDPVSVEINMFGKNTYIFSEKDNVNEINNVTAQIFEKQHYNQFGKERYALAYKTGDYTGTNAVEVGYYTQIMGLGKTPYDVSLYNVKTPCALSNNNATCNFWVSIENVGIKAVENYDDVFYYFQWAVSQAAPARRLYVERNAVFDWWYGWASGGFVADSYFAAKAGSYTQQQYYYRNCYVKNEAYGVNWNQVIQGCDGNTVDTSSMTSLKNNNGKTNWDNRKSTTVIDNTPEIREKPFLYFDEDSKSYKVFVPAVRKNSKGISWSKDNMGEGTSISVEDNFYIANPDKDNADTINSQLAKGKNLILQPGVYYVDKPIKVEHENTIVMGLGLATIIPNNKESGMIVSDVGGVSICGIIFDAGNYSDSMLTIGKEGCNKDHSDNPIVLQDIFYRVGGTGELGRTKSCLVVNSNNTIIDHTWIWRADHGDHTGWYENTADNGLIVNGDNVTAYGLFCEHFQKYDVLWRGENGSTYFLQNEKCYDPQSQEGWMSHNGTKKGYAAYKVANNVKNHYAVGLGVYDVFINTNGASIYLDNAIEVPDAPNVTIENACIVEIANSEGPNVGINNIVNNTAPGIRNGKENNGGYCVQRLLSYNNGKSSSLNDAYIENADNPANIWKVDEIGENPSDDVNSEKDINRDVPSKDTEVPVYEMNDKLYEQKRNELESQNPGGANPTKPEETTKNEETTKPEETTKNEETTKPEETTRNEETTAGEGKNVTVGIYGYQISTSAEGIRTVYNVSDPDNDVESVGMVYGLKNMSDKEDMVVNSSDKNVYSFTATEKGKISYDAQNDYFAMTMKFNVNSKEFFKAKTYVRAYAKLKDGTYRYSDVEEYSIFDVADTLYNEGKVSTKESHDYLYDKILHFTDSSYKKVDYNWENSIVKNKDN